MTNANTPLALEDIALVEQNDANGKPALLVSTPYNQGFNDGLKQMGAKWVPALRKWAISATRRQLVENLVAKTFGNPDGKSYSFDLLVTPRSRTVVLNGRAVVDRPRRDAAVVSHFALILAEGELSRSEGSAAMPMITRDRLVYRVENWPVEPVVTGGEILNLEVL